MGHELATRRTFCHLNDKYILKKVVKAKTKVSQAVKVNKVVGSVDMSSRKVEAGLFLRQIRMVLMYVWILCILWR